MNAASSALVPRMLVAGVGNIFRSDDGFATAVVSWLDEHARATWPEWVRLRDFGIGGVHLAYELLNGYDDLVLVDAMHREGGGPGMLYVVQPNLDTLRGDQAPALDAHDLAPEAVLSLVPGLGGTLGRVTVIGCEPASTADGMDLSDVVSGRVPEAGRLVCELVTEVTRGQGCSPDPKGSIVRR
ncbi:hydrogenase maturation protease [Flexivirga alba]|uniref:Hydrogenase maturation protease n=1 Tax=Flexivirga alba TaxID=702742 RepID=A0ABW2AKV3_9MICO